MTRKKDALVQLEIPPLSQSRYEAMACELFYHESQTAGVRLESEPARRGTEFHKQIASYMEALRVEHVPTHYAKLEELARESSPEVKELLETFGDARYFDPDKIYDTELYIGADENFNIIEVRGRAERGQERKPGIVYECMIDLVVMESESEAEIEDWKTYFQIVDADSFQSKLYPLMLMIMNPAIETVRFVLSFVRYGDAQREVTWKKSDIPYLMEQARQARVRQIKLHTKGVEKMKATPGRQCVYCPLLLTDCPMKKVNPFAAMPNDQRVGFAIWMKAAKKENDRIVKDILAEHGPIEYKDANGKVYIAEFQRYERTKFPLDETNPLIGMWIEAHPDDQKFVDRLCVSGLSTPIKSDKRARLAAALMDIAEITVGTKLVIGLADDEDDDQ
jgi:hypothetical protein